MPRLRYYKNYEQISDSQDGEINNDLDTNNQLETTNTIKEGRCDLKGWYSTDNIITSLSDKQIERNIQYHKTQIRLMEEELLNRALGIRVHIPFVLPDFGYNEKLEYENSRKDYKKNSEVRYHMKQLLPVLKNIRKKYGMDAFVYCRDSWIELLEDYYEKEGR